MRVAVRNGLTWLAVAGVVFASLPAYGQGVPDAGAIQGQNDISQDDLQRLRPPQPGEDGEAVTGPPRDVLPEFPAGGLTFTLTRVEFTKSEFLSETELAAIAAPFVGRAIDFSQIRALLAAVDARYAEMGIITASASLPPQEIDGGVLKIELIEGRVGKVSMEGAGRSADWVTSRVNVTPGEVVDIRRLGPDVSTQNRIGEAKVRTILQPGTEFGLTDVTLSVTEPPRNTLEIFADNFGSPSVGRYQLGGLFQHYGLLGLDDRLKFYGVWAEGNLAGNVSYTFGFAPTGGRVGLSYTHSKIRVIDGAFTALDINGETRAGGISVAQPIYAAGPWLGLFNLGGTLTRSMTRAGDVPITDNITRKGTAGVTVNYYGERLAFSISPYYAYSHTDLKVTGAAQQVHFFGGSASLTAVLPAELLLQGTGSWQYSSEALVTGDQLFQIGGATTVRGYDSGAAAGGSGYYVSLEVHKDMSQVLSGLDLFTFIDHGQVFSTSPAQTTLTGIGAGFSYSFLDRANLEVTVAAPVARPLPGQPEFTVFGRLVVKAF